MELCGRFQVDVLVQLGLRVSVSPAVLLDAARALDECKPADEVARIRGRALLTQLDVLAFEEAQGERGAVQRHISISPSRKLTMDLQT